MTGETDSIIERKLRRMGAEFKIDADGDKYFASPKHDIVFSHSPGKAGWICLWFDVCRGTKMDAESILKMVTLLEAADELFVRREFTDEAKMKAIDDFVDAWNKAERPKEER